MVRWIRWISGILLAGALTMLPAFFIMHPAGKVDMHNLNPFQYWIRFLAVPSFAFGLFLFLACWFVPSQKKKAGILVFGLGCLFISLGAYQHYSDDGYLHKDYLLRYTGFIVCLIFGYLISQTKFRKERWLSS